MSLGVRSALTRGNDGAILGGCSGTSTEAIFHVISHSLLVLFTAQRWAKTILNTPTTSTITTIDLSCSTQTVAILSRRKNHYLHPPSISPSLSLPLTHFLSLFALRFSSFATLASPRDKQKHSKNSCDNSVFLFPGSPTVGTFADVAQRLGRETL